MKGTRKEKMNYAFSHLPDCFLYRIHGISSKSVVLQICSDHDLILNTWCEIHPVDIKHLYHDSVQTLLSVRFPPTHMRTTLTDYTRYLHFLAIWAQPPHLTAINFNGLFGLRYPQPLECRVTSLLSCHASVDMLLTAGGRYQYGRVGLLRVYMQQRHYLCSTDAQSFWILSLLTEPCFSLNTYLKYLLFMLWSKQIWPHWYYWVRNFEDATYVPLFINIALFSVHMLFLYTIRLSNNPEKIISRFPQKKY